MSRGLPGNSAGIKNYSISVDATATGFDVIDNPLRLSDFRHISGAKVMKVL
jgi:hypothetical protein